MTPDQKPKRWTGYAKIIKIIQKADNYYFWVRVMDDPYGDQELLEGACFFREAMGHGWMKDHLKEHDMVAVQLPARFGDRDWMMYCAQNFDQPTRYKPVIREFLEDAERRDKEWSKDFQRRQQAALEEANKKEKEKAALARQTPIQKVLDVQQTSNTRQGVRVQCTLTHEVIKLLERDAAAANFNVSDHRWRGQYIRHLIMRSLKRQAV